MSGKSENLIKQLKEWTHRLKNTKFLDEIFEVVKEINKKVEYDRSYMTNPHIIDAAYDLCFVFAVALTIEDLGRLKLVYKVYFKICLVFRQMSIYSMFARNEAYPFKTDCLSLYAGLQNFNEFVHVFGETAKGTIKAIYKTFLESSVRYSHNSKYFPLCIENMILVFNLKLEKSEDHDYLYTTIISNLENPHKTVQDLLISLFSKYIVSENTDSYEVVKDILTNMPWINSHKYHLLNVIVETRSSMLLEHKLFELEEFLRGICLSLKYRNLLSPGRFLVKSIFKKALFRREFLLVLVEVFKERSDYEIKNLSTHWWNLFDVEFVEDFYKILELDSNFEDLVEKEHFKYLQENQFERLIVARNLFQKQFYTHKDLEKIDNFIKEKTEMFEEVSNPVKKQIMEILMMNILRKKCEEEEFFQDLRFLLEFIRENAGIDDSTFRDDLLKKIPDLFAFLATKKFKNRAKVKDVFLFIKTEIYVPGIKSHSYQLIIFNLKLLQIILKQFCSVEKLTNGCKIEEIRLFGEYLKEHIWNFQDDRTFYQLLNLLRNEFSDVKDIACDLLIKFFIQKQELLENIIKENTDFQNFLEFINKFQEFLTQKDIDTANTAHFYYKLKYEYLKHTKTFSNFAYQEFQELQEELKENLKDFKSDSVLSMIEGKHLFSLINCISIHLSDPKTSPGIDNFKPMIVLIGLIVSALLQKINIAESFDNVGPNFDILDKSLLELIEKSSHKPTDFEACKKQLLLSIWYTFKACSEISVSLANLVNKQVSGEDKSYLILMDTLIGVNVNILKRCCHKGAIESAGLAIGNITKIITLEASKTLIQPSHDDNFLGKVVNVLQKKVEFSREITNPNHQDIRCIRGQILMFNHILKNDNTKNKDFLRVALEGLIVKIKVTSFEDTKQLKFVDTIQALHIHQLASLVKDSNLLEYLIPYLDEIIVATFHAFKDYEDWPMRNALLQLIGAIIPKISNQKQHFIVLDNLDYEPKNITYYENYVKLTYAFRTAVFDLRYNRSEVSSTYLVVLLEYFSHFEFRSFGEHYPEIDSLGIALRELLESPTDKIRYLASKCFAQFQDLNKKMPEEIVKKTENVITSSNENYAHSCILSVLFMLKRYETCSHHMIKNFNRNEFFEKLRSIFRNRHQELMKRKCSYYFRSYLLDLLIYLEFKFEDSVMQNLMFCWPAKNNIGFCVFKQKLTKYLTAESEGEQTLDQNNNDQSEI